MPLPTVSRLFSSALRTQLVSVANLTSKPPKHNVSATDMGIAMIALYGAMLIPSCWVLAHLEDYKKGW